MEDCDTLCITCAAAAPTHPRPPLTIPRSSPKIRDFDDSWALVYLLSRSIPGDAARDFDFLLVQCSTFNTTNRARIASKILHDLGRYDVAVGVGVYTGEDAMRQLPAAAGWELADFVAAGGTVYYGTDQLATLLATGSAADPIFAVEIAPATSLGDVVGAAPALAKTTVLSAMSGSVYHGYGNSSAPEREYNVYIDIPASQRMYAAEWLSPLLMAPLDTSGLLRCGAPEFSDLIAANNSAHPYAQVLIKNYDIWSGSVPTNTSVSDTLYDAQAAFSMLYYSQQWAQGAPPAVPGLSFQVLPIVRCRRACLLCAARCHANCHLFPTPPPPPSLDPAVGEQQRLYSDRPRGAHSVDRDALSLWPAERHAHYLPRPDRLNHCRALKKPKGNFVHVYQRLSSPRTRRLRLRRCPPRPRPRRRRW